MNVAKFKFQADNSVQYITSVKEIIDDEHFQRYSSLLLYTSTMFHVIFCNKFIRDTSIAQRRCRFKSESNLTHFPIYTRGLFMQECRLELVYELCGCIPHFYPNRSKLFN